MSNGGMTEVGSCRGDGSIRYWCAREALRQGEIRLEQQLAAIDDVRARSGWLVGWCVTLAAALFAGAAAGYFPIPAAAAAVLAVLAAFCCVAVLWPRAWDSAGGWASWVMTEPYETELEVLEALAQGCVASAAENGLRIARASFLLRAALVLFIAAPVVGAIIWVLPL